MEQNKRPEGAEVGSKKQEVRKTRIFKPHGSFLSSYILLRTSYFLLRSSYFLPRTSYFVYLFYLNYLDSNVIQTTSICISKLIPHLQFYPVYIKQLLLNYISLVRLWLNYMLRPAVKVLSMARCIGYIMEWMGILTRCLPWKSPSRSGRRIIPQNSGSGNWTFLKPSLFRMKVPGNNCPAVMRRSWSGWPNTIYR
jgi:hypothetical protein